MKGLSFHEQIRDLMQPEICRLPGRHGWLSDAAREGGDLYSQNAYIHASSIWMFRYHEVSPSKMFSVSGGEQGCLMEESEGVCGECGRVVSGDSESRVRISPNTKYVIHNTNYLELSYKSETCSLLIVINAFKKLP